MKTYQFLQAAARKDPDALALLAPQRTSISYQELLQHLQNNQQELNNLGVGRNDRVAIVLPNGPEMASAFLSVSSAATTAPLNPNYQETEYDFYLTDLDAKALLISRSVDSPARKVAVSKGIPVLELIPDPNVAGLFKIVGDSQPLMAEGGFTEDDDVALVLHTSGTTSRPKIVPLTHRNLSVSANNIRTALVLTGGDRCLNIMPLFHIHGLMAAVLASMAAGSSVVCTPGYDITRFYEWLEEFSPTWYTAVPTMHQAILDRVTSNQDIIARTRLRFVRSSSASLPPQVMKELENTFRTTVIEAYGMTEASHQMASNPLPPLEQKPGSVGLPAGPKVSIMAENGSTLLGKEQIGEIVIKGENVTLGYANNPQANATAFTNGWFRTGDQGYFDADGYLFITGRLKETINKGGEKISPREVDEVLLSHPGVAQAVTFAMPDARLGEEVAAAVILKDSSVSERDLRLHVAEFLVDFKVPRKILFLDEIPKGPTGKLQRIGLADVLGLEVVETTGKIERPYVPPRTESESLLVRIWQEVLKLPRVGVQDRFLEIGGDSFLATLLVYRISQETGVQLTLVDFANAPTIEEQVRVIENLKQGRPITPKTGLLELTIINENGKNPPIFMVPANPINSLNLPNLGRGLGKDYPLFGLTPYPTRFGDQDVIEEVVALNLREIRTLQPQGPYYLGGNCSGGIVALEIARQLKLAGENVPFVFMIEAYGLNYPRRKSWIPAPIFRIILLVYTIQAYLIGFYRFYFPWKKGNFGILWSRQVRRFRHWIAKLTRQRDKLPGTFFEIRPGKNYTLESYPGDILLFRAEKQPLGAQEDDYLGWRDIIKGKLDVIEIKGSHRSLYPGSGAIAIGRHVAAFMEENFS